MKVKMKRIFKYLFLLMVFMPGLVFGSTGYITQGDNVKLEEDFDRTHFVFGDSINVNNKTDGLYFIFGDEVVYDSDNQYTALFGNKVNIAGKMKDAAIFGNSVVIENATIDRDIVIFGNNVKIEGKISGNVAIYGRNVTISKSELLGNVVVKGGSLKIDKDTSISGNLSYNEDMDVVIEGDIHDITINKNVEVITTKDIVMGHIYKIIRLLVIFLGMYLLIPKIFNNMSDKVGKNIGYGLLCFIAMPLLLLILLFTNFATSIAIIGIMLYIIMAMISLVLCGYVLGELIFTKVFKLKEERMYLNGFVGIIVLYLIALVPYLGGLVTFASLVYAFGMMANKYLEYRNK